MRRTGRESPRGFPGTGMLVGVACTGPGRAHTESGAERGTGQRGRPDPGDAADAGAALPPKRALQRPV